jgi:dTDP-4-amino-4,6-dideoxygalactose transaminase
LLERGIGCQVVYPGPVQQQPAYRDLDYKEGSLPVSEAHLKQILCLPMFAELTETEVRQVSEAIRTFYGRSS